VDRLERVVAAAVVAAFLSGCMADRGPAPEPVASSSAPIVDGTRDNTPAVVFLYNLAGAACTASIISPRVVLTAKHCIQGGSSSAAPARQFRVYTGRSTSEFTSEYRVQEIRPAPGCWNLCGDASDVAVLILSSPVSEVPLEVSFDEPGWLAGQTIRAVGYGQTPAGGSGIKYTTMKQVEGTGRGLIFVEPAVCQGDSGGPLIGPDGKVYGVASFITSPDGMSRPTCGTAPGAYNSINRHRDLIEGAIEDAGDCISGGDEMCNGVDDDCDDAVDETCTPLGESCGSDDECVGNDCSDTPAGRICTQDCDPLRPSLGCPPGMYCSNVGGCDGKCVSGAPGSGGNGADCTEDTECASLFCVDPGDGRQRCLDPCRGDEGVCLAGEACAAVPGACGGCVGAGIVAGRRGLGEPCATDDDCHSGSCLEDGASTYCTRDCTDDEACADGFHCRDELCVRGVRGGVGNRCIDNSDCSEGNLCARSGDRSWCTTFCDSEMCPEGFECVDAGGAMVCSPEGSLVGESCEVNEDCLSGLCIDAPSGGRACTRLCGGESHCASGFECVRTSDGINNVCVEPTRPPSDEGSCSVGRNGQGAGGLALLLGALLGLVFRRRR